MVKYQPPFSFWPPPNLFRETTEVTAWVGLRDDALYQTLQQVRSAAVKRIVDAHHDRNARTIYPSRH